MKEDIFEPRLYDACVYFVFYVIVYIMYRFIKAFFFLTIIAAAVLVVALFVYAFNRGGEYDKTDSVPYQLYMHMARQKMDELAS